MQWWKNSRAWPALLILGTLVVVALGKDFLANDRPLYCRIGGTVYFPGLRTLWQDPALPYKQPALDSIQRNFLWRRFPYDAAVFAPVAFAPGELPMSPDTTVRLALPGAIHPGPGRRFRHWLGTDVDGFDVAAGLIGGARVAMMAGAIAMGIAFLIGVTLGAIAGYWGDDRLRMHRGQMWLILLSLPLAWFYQNAVQQQFTDTNSIWLRWSIRLVTVFLVLFLAGFLGRLLNRSTFFAKRTVIPADLLIMRLADVFNAVPILLVIIAFAAMLQAETQSLWVMIFLIGAFTWPNVALFIRAELLRIREMDYITAAKGMGLPDWRIMVRHGLPNALRATYTTLAMGVAVAILLEASLSFLGYGDISLHGATWGSLLRNARSNPQLWWISLPPGLAIGLTILALNTLGEVLSERR